MKRKSLLSLLFAIAVLPLMGQTVQHGVIQEYNERAKKTALPGVELTIRSAGSTVSDKKGRFSLNFLTLKPGERVNVRRIEKSGYEIFNKEAVEQWNINPTTPFVIVMCRSDRFKRIRDNYERVSSESYRRQLQKEEAALARKRQEGKLREEEYQRKLYELRENYERQLDNLENYVDRFSRIDLSELTETEREIIGLVQSGRIDEAIARYEQENYVDKYLHEAGQLQEVTSAVEQLTAIQQEKQQACADLLAAIDRQIETLQLAGGESNNRKTVELLKTVADADTTNVEWLLKTGTFISEYCADYTAALRYYQMALSSATAMYGNESDLVAEAYNRIGILYDKTDDYANAMKYHFMAMSIREKLWEAEDISVATSYNNLGVALNKQGQDALALEFLLKSLKIYEEANDSEHEMLATLYNNIGGAYESLQDYTNALKYYEMAMSLRRNKFGSDHKSVAESLNNLGALYAVMGDNDKALEYFFKSLEIKSKIFGEWHPDIAMTYKNIGATYDNMEDYTHAIESHKKALAIYERVFGNRHISVAQSNRDIGYIYDYQGKHGESLEYLYKALDIMEDVMGVDHQDVLYLECVILNTLDKTRDTDASYLNKLNDFMSDKAWIATVKDADSPAGKLGMSGEYYVLEFADWTYNTHGDLMTKNQQLAGKPKSVLVLKDNIVARFDFENRLGVSLGIKHISHAERQRINDLYLQWKKENS